MTDPDNEKWDAIVIGAGQGGLSAAAYLAVSGLRVLVVEHHTVAGGYGQVFRRQGRYEFDVGTHYLGDCGPDGILPSVYRGLGLADRIEFREIDPDCFDRTVLPSLEVRVPRGWALYRERMAEALPAEADAVRRFVDTCAAIAQRQRDLTVGPGAAFRPAGEPSTLTGPQLPMYTLGRLMDDHGLSARARTALAAQIGNYGVAPGAVAAVSHIAMLAEYMRGAYYPAGGGQMLSATLVEALEANGGQLHTRCLVQRILVEQGAAAGVALTDGTVHRAPVIVSNADYRRTMLDLVGPDHLPEVLVSRVRRATMALPLVTLYLAVRADAFTPPACNIWWYETEDIDAIFTELDAGPLREPRFAFISSGSAKDGRSPADTGHLTTRRTGQVAHHTLEVMTLCHPTHGWTDDDATLTHDYRDQPGYQAGKQHLAGSLLSMAERALGPIRPYLLHSELSTPQSSVRFIRSTGGTPYGLAATTRQLGVMRPDHRTALPGLFLVGASSRSGFGIGAVTAGGVRCAEAVLGQSLLAEVLAGKVFGDAGRLPVRSPGWDPLLASRGQRATRHRRPPRERSGT